MSRARKTQAAMLIWLLALVLDLGWFSLDKAFLTPDAPTYLVPADNMRAGRGFTNARLEPETRRTPAYPVMLALAQDLDITLEGVVLLQHLVRSLIAVGVFLLAERLFRSPFIAIGAGAVFALDLTSVIWANRIMSETLFTLALFALFAMLCAWPRRGLACWTWSIATGMFAGFTVLIRPISILVFVPIGFYLLATRRRHAFLPILLTASSFAVFPASWALYNRSRVGVATVSSISADNLLMYRAAGVVAEDSGGPFYPNFLEAQRDLAKAAEAEGRRTFGRAFDTLPHAQKASVYSGVAVRILRDHPWALLKLAARGVATTLLGGGATDLMAITGLSARAARFLILAYTGPWLVVAWIGLVFLFRRHRPAFWAILLFTGYFVGISAGAEAYSRFRVPIMPLYAMAVAAGLNFVWNRFRVSPPETQVPGSSRV